MLMLLSENDLSDNQEDKNKTSETIQTRDARTPSIKHYLQALLNTTMTKEIVSLALTLLVYYAMFVTSVTKTKKASPAQLFFTNSSCVQDYYDGNLGAAMKQAIQSEVSIILLYAPWDADSQCARHEFDVTCRFYFKQVKFFAINCWQPGGQCRTHFSKLNRFPTLLVIRRGRSVAEVSNVQFKGHWYADHLISFVTHVLNPISRIDSSEHLSRFKSNNDGLVVLCADVQSPRGARLYRVFHSVALKFLEVDPHRDVRFAVVLNSRVARYLTRAFPALVLVNFNHSANYKGNFTEGNIMEWILASLGAKPVNWVNLSGTKSMTLNYYLKNETSLVLFTPRNLLRNINLYYNLLKIIAAEFTKNCHPFIYDTTSSPSSSLEEKREHYQILINHLVVNSIVEAANERILADTCDQLKMKIIEKIIARRKALDRGSILKRSLAKREIQRVKTFANQTLDNPSGQSFDGDLFGSFVLNINKETGVLFPVSSSNVEDIFNVSSTITSSNFVSAVANQTEDKTETFIDKFSIMNLFYENSKQMCKLLRVANRILRVPNIGDLHGQEAGVSSGKMNGYSAESLNAQAGPSSTSSFTGDWGNAFSDCASNKSLNFLSLDSKRYKYLLDNLNIDLSAYKDETLALIVDVVNNNENVYLLGANITRDSLVVFVKDYLGDRLTRYKRNNNFGDPADPKEKVPSRNVLSLNRKFDSPPLNASILELNAVNFQAITHNAHANVIVLFYSKYCGHCLPYSHVFFLLSHILSHIRELRFARIDVDTNDLSYPFVPVGIPGLLLFPAGHPENSASYDRSEPFSQTNLLGFLLREIPDSALGIHIYLVVCLKTNRGHAIECLGNVNKLLHAYISRLKVKVYKAYAHFPLSSSLFSSSRPPSLSTNLTRKIKKYLIRLKYFRCVQLFTRNHLMIGTARSNRRTTARHVRHLYCVYQKCAGQIAHIDKVYARLSDKRLQAPALTWRAKEEL